MKQRTSLTLQLAEQYVCEDSGTIETYNLSEGLLSEAAAGADSNITIASTLYNMPFIYRTFLLWVLI